MKIQPLGRTGVDVARIAFGCMRYLGTWDPAEVDGESRRNAFACLDAAREAGITLIDHADIYARTASESVFGEWLAANPNERDAIVLATKCGILFGGGGPKDPQRYDLSARHIERSAEASLGRLRTDVIDVYQLHRPDLLLDVREVAAAFGRLRAAGKVRHFGVSNFRPSLVEALRAACADVGIDLVVNQIELHALEPDMLTDGLLDQCQQHDITPVAWSPLAGGRLGDDADAKADDRLARLHAELDAVAEDLGITRSIVAIAYLLKHPAKVIPIIGTSRPERVTALAAAADVELSREQWYRLHLAARGERLP